MIELNVGEKQVVLLSKGHYPLDSLQLVVAKAMTLPTSHVTQETVYRYVVRLYCRLYDAGYIGTDYRELMLHWFKSSGSITRGYVAKDLLSHIAGCVVEGLDLEIDADYVRAVEEEYVAVASVG